MEEAQIFFSFQKVLALNFVKKVLFLMDVRSCPLMEYALRTVDRLLEEMERGHTNAIIAQNNNAVNNKKDDRHFEFMTHYLESFTKLPLD